MGTIQLINVSQGELTQQIIEGVKPHLENFIKEHFAQQQVGKEFLTRKETAKFFDISLVCLHDWIKKGIVTHYKCGNRTYFNRAELVQQLFNSNKVA